MTTLGRDRVHRFIYYLLGWPTPRAWVRGLSERKFRKVMRFAFNAMARANDHPVRAVPRPAWYPKRYIYRT